MQAFDPDIAAAIASGEPILDCSDAAEPPFDGYVVDVVLASSAARPYAFRLTAPCATDPRGAAAAALGPEVAGGGDRVEWVVEPPGRAHPLHHLLLFLSPKEGKPGSTVDRLLAALTAVQAALGPGVADP